MKTLRFLIVAWLATTVVCRAQTVIVTNDGWNFTADFTGLAVTNDTSDDGSNQDQSSFSPLGIPSPPSIAEAVTPEIQALADGLQDDPLRIFNYVHDHIRYVLYFGSRKGANLTLLEKSGNDFDQCALLVALLQAAGYSNSVGYQFGWMLLPYDNPDGSHRDLHHWLGLNFTNSDWPTTSAYLDTLFRALRNYPADSYNFDNNTYGFQRVWVTLAVGGTNYYLDPAFKVSEPIPGLINLATAMGLDTNALMNAVGGFETNASGLNYVTNLNENAMRGTLAGYTTNLLNYLQSNYPNASVEQILSGQYIVPSTNTALSQCFPFQPSNWSGTMPVVSWTYEPTNMMSTFAVNFAGTNFACFLPQLQGQRLSLIASNNGVMRLWLDDNIMVQGNTGGGTGTSNVTINVAHPHGTWNTTNNTFVSQPRIFTSAKPYQKANAAYAIIYAFEPDWGWLQERQNKLDAYLQQGLTNTSPQVVGETLNVMGLNWQLQFESVNRMLATQIGIVPEFDHRIGRMAQESGFGYYVDVYMSQAAPASTVSLNDDHVIKWADHVSYFASAMEHGLIEQLQNTNLVAASTVKLLELANTNHQPIYLANSTNWTTVSSSLVHYSSSTLNSIYNSFIQSGYYVLLPQNGAIQIAGAGSWTGFGLVARIPGRSISMAIGDTNGVHFGGYVSDPNATVNTSFVDLSSYSQPQYFSSAPVFTPNLTSADPVNMADGTFQIQSTDLSLGQTEPRGLNFARYYNSRRRNSNLAGIGPGWIHNYYLNAATISAPQASLGGTTPQQVASMLVATEAALGIYNDAVPDPKNWTVEALIAKWGIDQITAKAVSVTLGKDTIQFIQQPDGSYTPPANCTMTLTQSGGTYTLQERRGRTFQFNNLGWGTNIVDQYNQSLNLTYTSSNWINTVTDWKKNRTLTFSYSGTPSKLASVSDGSRSVSLGYTGNDLTSVTDPENKTNTLTYDTNHQITATFNAASQMVVSNIYNSFGRVTTQFTQGDTNKTWHIFWSGWQTVSQDPAGGQQTYFFDDKTRLTGQQDALGNLTLQLYDGQNHVVTNISPMNEIYQSIYDGNNNLTYSIDPLGFTNQYIYDGNNSLIEAIDPLGHVSTFGWNTQFSLIGQTNSAGDWINYTFNSSDGTFATRADSGGTIQYDSYDGYGQLTHITYRDNSLNSLGTESFINSSFGDVTNHTDGNGNATSYQYNKRRQLTVTTGPTNLAMALGYDAVGNALTSTNARGFVAVNAWSATRHLLATILPTAPQGTAVLTNIYDNRDWLVRSLDPLQNPTLYTNDLAGRLISQTDPVQRTTRFSLDADGRKLAAVNATNETTSQTWDARGEMIQLTDGAGHTSGRSYDPAGNQIFLTNRNSKLWQFKFDSANRVTNTITPRGYSSTVAFNHQGLPALTTDPAGRITTNNFDGKKRLTSRADSVGTTIYGFDANDNCTSIAENGKTNRWSLDAYNHVANYTDANGFLIQYRRDAAGNVTNLIYPGGKNVYYTFDSHNHPTNVTDWAGRQTAIAYDLNDHVIGITRPNGTHRAISLNAAGQQTNILETTAVGFPVAWFIFTWDPAGRAQWEFAAPPPHVPTVAVRNMTYYDDNMLKTFNGVNVGNDANGNLTNAPLTGTNFAFYVYDARNRLSNVGGVTNTYDPAGNRIGTTYGTNSVLYVVNPNAALPQVLMRIKNGVTNYYIYGVGLLYEVTETATATNTRTYIPDFRGSTVALTDDGGNVTDRIEYSLYGLTTYHVGKTDTPFLFNGCYGVMTDPNGLLYMRARYYNPNLCRFINPDPSGFAGGLNFYAYAAGNPVSYSDPTGLGAVGDNQNTPSLTGNNTTPADLSNPFALNPNDLQNKPQPCIVCHGVSAGGFNGNVNSFYGLTAIPGSGPNAMQGYQTLENLSVAATPLVAGPAGGAIGASLDAVVVTGTVGGTVTLAEGETVIGVVVNGQVVPQSVMAPIASHAVAAQAGGALTAEGTLIPGAQAFTAINSGGQITVLGSGTFGGTMNVSQTTISAVRAFFTAP